MATKNTTIKIKRSTIADAVPTTSNLSVGELAINHADGKLYAVTTVANVVTGVTQINSGGGGGIYDPANVAITGGTISAISANGVNFRLDGSMVYIGVTESIGDIHCQSVFNTQMQTSSTAVIDNIRTNSQVIELNPFDLPITRNWDGQTMSSSSGSSLPQSFCYTGWATSSSNYFDNVKAINYYYPSSYVLCSTGSGNYGTNGLFHSTDGENFTQSTVSSNVGYSGVAHDGMNFIASILNNSSMGAVRNYLKSTNNGVTWTSTSMGTSVPLCNWTGVTKVDSGVVFVSKNNNVSVLRTSGMPVTHTQGTMPSSAPWSNLGSFTTDTGLTYAICFSSDSTNIGNTMAVTNDGINWVSVSLPISSFWGSWAFTPTYGGGGYITVFSTSDSSPNNSWNAIATIQVIAGIYPMDWTTAPSITIDYVTDFLADPTTPGTGNCYQVRSVASTNGSLTVIGEEYDSSTSTYLPTTRAFSKSLFGCGAWEVLAVTSNQYRLLIPEGPKFVAVSGSPVGPTPSDATEIINVAPSFTQLDYLNIYSPKSILVLDSPRSSATINCNLGSWIATVGSITKLLSLSLKIMATQDITALTITGLDSYDATTVISTNIPTSMTAGQWIELMYVSDIKTWFFN